MLRQIKNADMQPDVPHRGYLETYAYYPGMMPGLDEGELLACVSPGSPYDASAWLRGPEEEVLAELERRVFDQWPRDQVGASFAKRLVRDLREYRVVAMVLRRLGWVALVRLYEPAQRETDRLARAMLLSWIRAELFAFAPGCGTPDVKEKLLKGVTVGYAPGRAPANGAALAHLVYRDEGGAWRLSASEGGASYHGPVFLEDGEARREAAHLYGAGMAPNRYPRGATAPPERAAPILIAG